MAIIGVTWRITAKGNSASSIHLRLHQDDGEAHAADQRQDERRDGDAQRRPAASG